MAAMALLVGAGCGDVGPGEVTPDSGEAALEERLLAPEQVERLAVQEAATPRLEALHSEDRGRTLKVRYEAATGIPGFLSGDLRVPGHDRDPEGHARAVLRELSDLYAGIDADTDLDLVRVDEGQAGYRHVRFAQRVDGVRVHGAHLHVHIDDTGAVTSLGGSLLPDASPATPEIAPAAAIEEAVTHLAEQEGHGSRFARLDGADATVEQVLFQHAMYGGLDRSIHTAWSVTAADAEVLVDAVDGNVLTWFDGRPPTMNREIWDHDNGGPDLWYRDSPAFNSGCDADCQAVRTHSETIYDFWDDTHGRDSYDDAGSDLLSYVHYNDQGQNAFGGNGSTWHADGMVDQDVTVHEWTHSLTAWTAGLVYQDGSGAMSEHFSDAFTMVLDPDWAYGDESPGQSMANPTRSFSDPHLNGFNPAAWPTAANNGQPDHMDEYLTAADVYCAAFAGNDNGCVHFNSGILNHFVYLFSEGGTKDDITIKGQGIDALEPLLWDVLVNRLGANSDFFDYEDEMKEACTAEYGLGSDVCVSVHDALAAVGLGDPVNDGKGAYAYLGKSVVAADMDGDGTDDVIAGAPRADFGTATDTGVVNFYMSDGGAVGGDPIVFPQTMFGGATESYDMFGFSLDTGDIDGDGTPDLVIGGYGEDTGAAYWAGVGFYMINDGTGLGGETGYLFQSGGTGAESNDQAGKAIALGDFDCDGFDDVALGAPYEDWGSTTDAGAITVHYSGGGAPGSAGSDVLIQNGGVATSTEVGDNFGFSLAVGDFDDDGCDDLAVGSPEEDWGSTQATGVLVVLYGDDSGISTSGAQTFGPGFFGLSGESYPRLGYKVAAGDFDADGYDDLAVSAPYADAGGVADAGEVYVLTGSANKLQDDDITLTQGGMFGSDEAYDHTGMALATGDYDGDGADDLLIGVPDEDYGSTSNTGLAIIVYGATGTGLDEDDSYTVWQQGNGESRETGDGFGFGVAIGDVFNGSGGLIVGAPYENTADGTDVGTVRLSPYAWQYSAANLY